MIWLMPPHGLRQALHRGIDGLRQAGQIATLVGLHALLEVAIGQCVHRVRHCLQTGLHRVEQGIDRVGRLPHFVG